MRIGLIYDLRDEYLIAGYTEDETAEFDRPDTIDAIEDALRQLGHEVDRVGNVHKLVARLACTDRWDLVFNIAEGMHGPGREAQVPAILDAWEIPYTFSDPLVMSVSLHKAMTKLLLRDAGLPTPDWHVVEELADVDKVSLPFPLLAKPIAEGTGKGVDPTSKVTDTAGLWRVCERLLSRYDQPVLVERFLPGREFTVGVLGTGADAEVLGTLEVLLRDDAEPDVYSYVNKEHCEELCEYRLARGDRDEPVRRAEVIALAAWRALGGRDGGRVDVRCDETGTPQLLEINPLAGLHPTHSDLPMIGTAVGLPYVELIRRIVDSAAGRASRRAAAGTLCLR